MLFYFLIYKDNGHHDSARIIPDPAGMRLLIKIQPYRNIKKHRSTLQLTTEQGRGFADPGSVFFSLN